MRLVCLLILFYLQPAKTPKTATKLKLTTPKTPATGEGKKKATPKSTKPKSTSKKAAAAAAAAKAGSEEDGTPDEPKPLTPAEAKQKKEKNGKKPHASSSESPYPNRGLGSIADTRTIVLYLRHRLQKGLLTRDAEPKEEEMEEMAKHIQALEGYADLEVSIIRTTKINKVLRAILKLTSIPKDEELGIKKRSNELLQTWTKRLEEPSETAGAGKEDGKKEDSAAAATNGDKAEHKAEENGAEKATGDEEKASGEEQDAEPAKPADTGAEVEAAGKMDVDTSETKPEPETETAATETATETATAPTATGTTA